VIYFLKFEKLFPVLYKLAELGATSETIEISTTRLAELLGFSQQTASRHLIELERMGLIKRETSRRGWKIRLTEKGLSMLKQIYYGLKKVIEGVKMGMIKIEGEVFTGLGEGAYYVSKEGYIKQFVKKLGFKPYPGTLNLRLKAEKDLKARSELESYPPIIIEGFESEGRSFGPVKCYKAIINNEVEGAVVIAMRSHYGPSVLELIAPIYLREKLKLKDGDKIEVRIPV